MTTPSGDARPPCAITDGDCPYICPSGTAPEGADVVAARYRGMDCNCGVGHLATVAPWLHSYTCPIAIVAALATTRRAAFAAGVEASARVALNLMRERIDDINEGRLAVEHAPTWYVASVCSVYGQEVAAGILALKPEEPRDG